MTGGLIFIAGLIVGGCIAVMLLGCLQINRINKYESTINKLHTEDNKKQTILIAKNILYTFVVNKNLLQTNMYSYLLSKVLDRTLNEVPLLYETFTIPLPPGRLYFLRLKKTP